VSRTFPKSVWRGLCMIGVSRVKEGHRYIARYNLFYRYRRLANQAPALPGKLTE